MNRLTPLLIASLLLASCKTAHNPPAQASSMATGQFGALLIRQREGIGTNVRLLGDAVPDVLHELQPLGDR